MTWNGNVWHFALSQELIVWLKVRQKAGICIWNFKIFPGRPTPAPTPSTAVSAVRGGNLLIWATLTMSILLLRSQGCRWRKWAWLAWG